MKSRQSKFNNPSATAQDYVERLILIAIITTCIALLFILGGCGKDERDPETDRVRKMLAANQWKVESVNIDGTDGTSAFAGLTVEFTNTGFTTTNGGVVWPSTGTWTFADESGKTIMRGDGILITVQEITKAKLVVNFMWLTTTFGPGRVSSTSGEHVFTFVK